MNILFLATFPIIPFEGGVQQVTNTLSKEFLHRGHNVIYLCFGRKHKLNYPNFLCDQLYIELNNQSDKDIKNEINNIVSQYNITHIINQTCNEESSRIISNLPLALQNKVIYTYHIIPFSYMNYTRKQILAYSVHNYRQLLFKSVSVICPAVYKSFFLRIEKKNMIKGMQLATKFCFISDKFYMNVLNVLPDAPKEKFVAINNPNTYSVQKHLPIFEEREKAVIWVGRVENSSKNIFGFLKMWVLFSKYNPDWKAYIIGNGGDLDYFKSYTAKKKITNIHFEGYQKDVMPYYKKCRFVTVTSFSESWGMILTEAMTCGCIPVAFNTFATLYDIIDDGQNGLICKLNEKNMADRLYTTANDINLCKSLSNNAIEKAKKFDSKKIADQWIALLESI